MNGQESDIGRFREQVQQRGPGKTAMTVGFSPRNLPCTELVDLYEARLGIIYMECHCNVLKATLMHFVFISERGRHRFPR